ncbi:serine hydrolase domain-containing protein [Cytobacillus sp. FJAT-54145]|uniref:Serine hydrolase domain-containing protein n=1 Tax=Cytobacillus spartinae TaxID=3299023 RepID=A0ABW6KB62_9BACI
MIGVLIIGAFFLIPKQNEAFATIATQNEKIIKIEAEIKRNMETHNIPGMSFALVDHNGVVFSKGYGTLDIRDDSLEINENTNFHIGSLSKVFVSLAIMKLQEERHIDIEKPVVDYLPWFSTKDEKLSRQIKIRHLLSHTSGLPGRLNVHDIEQTDSQEIMKEIKKKLKDVRLVGKPGDIYEYTNMNTDLLQLVIEEVTGEPFTTYMQDHLFAPLEMNRTGYFIFDDRHLSNTAMGHRYHWGKIKPYHEKLVYATSASAGLSSNVHDLSKFIQLLLNNGISHSESMINTGSLNQMFQPVQDRMAYNWYVDPHNVYMEGGLPGFTSTMVLSSDKTFGLVLLSNSKQSITLGTGFNIFKIVKGEEPVPLLASDYSKLNADAQLLRSLAVFFSIITLVVVGVTIVQIMMKKRKFSFVKLSAKEIGFTSMIIAAYLGVFYYLHVYAPFKIGVPTIFSFQKEPDLVSAILIFSIMYSIFSVALLVRTLFIRKTNHRKDSSELKM